MVGSDTDRVFQMTRFICPSLRVSVEIRKVPGRVRDLRGFGEKRGVVLKIGKDGKDDANDRTPCHVDS